MTGGVRNSVLGNHIVTSSLSLVPTRRLTGVYLGKRPLSCGVKYQNILILGARVYLDSGC